MLVNKYSIRCTGSNRRGGAHFLILIFSKISPNITLIITSNKFKRYLYFF